MVGIVERKKKKERIKKMVASILCIRRLDNIKKIIIVNVLSHLASN